MPCFLQPTLFVLAGWLFLLRVVTGSLVPESGVLSECPVSPGAEALIQGSRFLQPDGVEPTTQASEKGNSTQGSGNAVPRKEACTVLTNEAYRSNSWFASIAEDGASCVFGVDERDEGEHCVMVDGGRYGEFGWCYTTRGANLWGSCVEGCQFKRNDQRAVVAKIDALDAKISAKLESIEQQMANLAGKTPKSANITDGLVAKSKASQVGPFIPLEKTMRNETAPRNVTQDRLRANTTNATRPSPNATKANISKSDKENKKNGKKGEGGDKGKGKGKGKDQGKGKSKAKDKVEIKENVTADEGNDEDGSRNSTDGTNSTSSSQASGANSTLNSPISVYPNGTVATATTDGDGDDDDAGEDETGSGQNRAGEKVPASGRELESSFDRDFIEDGPPDNTTSDDATSADDQDARKEDNMGGEDEASNTDDNNSTEVRGEPEDMESGDDEASDDSEGEAGDDTEASAADKSVDDDSAGTIPPNLTAGSSDGNGTAWSRTLDFLR